MRPTRLTVGGWSAAVSVLVSVVLLAGAPSTTTSSAAPSAPAAVTSVHAAAAAPALKLIWGGNALPNGKSAFPTYRKLGVDVLQIQMSWRAVAPTRPADAADPDDPAYRWPAAVDTAVSRAKGSHIQVALLVRQTPGWANGGKAEQYTPDDPKDFATFLAAASRRYPAVRYWMVWGEPTRAGNYEPMPPGKPTGPRSYAKLLDAAYAGLKDVRRSNVVIGGNTWTLGSVTPVDFLRWMRLPNGKPPRLDYYGHNPYANRYPDISQGTYYKGLIDISDVDTFHALLKRSYPRRTPKLWLSEFSIADKKNRAFDFAVSRKEQARWLTAAYRLADSQPYVAGLGWYTLADEPASVPGNITNGLLTANGQEKPAFRAYQKAP